MPSKLGVSGQEAVLRTKEMRTVFELCRIEMGLEGRKRGRAWGVQERPTSTKQIKD